VKLKDIPELRRKVLSMLPTAQALLHGKLGISDRDVSDLVAILERELYLTKTRTLYKSRWTWMLHQLDGKEILATAPCLGCRLKCDPNACEKLYDWLVKPLSRESIGP